jgi:ligand-binding sensor domain-containing protein
MLRAYAVAGFISVVLAAGFLCSSALHAQQLTQYAHAAWRLQDGGIDASPVSIAQTTDGFLWIGTRNGLLRFDGVRFESWNDRIHELHACCAYSLLGSGDGSLWIGASPALARLKDGQLSVIASVAFHDHLIEDHRGRIWVARTRVQDGKGPLCEIQGTGLHCPTQAEELGCQHAGALTEDRNGTIWAADFGGKVCSWKDGAAAIFAAPPADAACKPAIQSLWEDSDGSILIGCSGGLRRLKQGRFVPFQAGSLDGDTLHGSKLLFDRSGDLWIGTANDGVYHLSRGVADHFGQADALSDDNILALYEDREGTIWAATANGIDRFRRLSVVSFSNKQGLQGPW